jgi:hypothetical protein
MVQPQSISTEMLAKGFTNGSLHRRQQRERRPRCECALETITLDNLIGSPRYFSLLRYRRAL